MKTVNPCVICGAETPEGRLVCASWQKGENMPRIIDANKLRKDVLDLPNCYNGFSDTYDKARILDLVDEQPTVDAVEAVRCKDCKYFDHSDFGKGEEYWCKHFVSTDDYTHCHKVTEDDFCAWGERE